MSHIINSPQKGHHGKCQDNCDLDSGLMLKCMNAKAASDLPCKNIIHAKCAGINEEVAKLYATYFCSDCTTSNDALHTQMNEVEEKAKNTYEKSQNTSRYVTVEEYEKLKGYATRLDEELRQKTEVVNNTREVNQQMHAKLEKQNVELQALKERLIALETRSSTQASGKGGAPHNLSPTSLFSHFDDTLHQAEDANESANSTRNSRFHSTTYTAPSTNRNEFRDMIKWPDYSKQAVEAAKQGDTNLMLVRASLAKPQPFTGDVTKWPTFLSEFVRTSARGNYRDYEDIDRLRDLIQGEAKEMFTAELSDPCAETLPTLKRLDDFFGVKGNAVRVALDRITQMQKVEKPQQKDQILKLYTGLKSYILQCRVHKQIHELTSQATLFIIESKMCSEHLSNWRNWVRNNGLVEDVDGVVSYLEEQIRELNLRARPKPPVKASVHATTEVTGGQTQESSQAKDDQGQASPPNKSEPRRGRGSGRGRGRGRGRGTKNYADYPCYYCKEKHPFYLCPKFLAEGVAKRVEIVNQLHICQRCLCNDRHKPPDCYNKLLRCYVAGCEIKNTHPKLHDHASERQRVTHIANPMNQVISHFAMVPGQVIGMNGKRIDTTIMYDTGSGISLVTDELFKQAQYESYDEYELTLHWATNATHQESHAKRFDLHFIPLGHKKAVKLEKLTAVSELDLPMQSQNAQELQSSYRHLSKIPLPSYERQKPQILLGLPHANYMSAITTVIGKNSEPVAALTQLGWTLYGAKQATPLCRPIYDSEFVNYACCERAENSSTNDDLLKLIHHYNSLENIGIKHQDASTMSKDDQRAADMIRDAMKFNPDTRRYEVGLLWAKENDTMPDNYEEAVIRLKSTEKRLIKLKMVDFVHEQFEKQISEGLLVETTREEANAYPRRNYVYGFLTYNNNKSPPKPRWVNDTAARYMGVSLNSKLLKGPDSLVPLPLAMCALREGKIAFQADVKSMFNQVELRKEDQYSQLTLWRNCKTDAAPRIYRQTRVIFGPTCSPAVTSAVRIRHARACASEFPEAAYVAEKQMYVDDAPESCDTVEEAAKIASDLIQMFGRISWPLVEFQSNSEELLRCLPQENVSKKSAGLVSNDDEDYVTKILGIFWKPKADVYVFRLNDDTIVKKCLNEGYTPTKKEMLGTVMRFFDPTGMISPFRIRGQMIMQKVWKAGTDWKMRPPKEICDEFVAWLNEFEIVTRLEIPRPYAQVSLKESKLTFHVFVDAGTEAYAAAVYLRIEHGTSIIVRLVASKARVAPVKYVSIPRLELMSALLGARLYTSVKEWHRRLKIEDYMCWVDSDVVFKWIRSPHLPRTTFTAPRITEIQELTSADRWFHVPSAKNVADYATKNRQMNYCDSSHEWYHGPAFLYESKESWPKQTESVSFPIDAISAIIKPLVSARPLLAGVMLSISAKIRSNWFSHVTVVALALRFIDNSRTKNKEEKRRGYISGDEFQRAENYIIGQVQRAVFPVEFEQLKMGKRISTTSKIAPLSPVYCPKTNLLRASTRLSNNFPFNMRSPPILPNFNEVTDAIVDYYHKINLHVGDNTIVASLRARVWILNARRAVRRCRARCLKCITQRKQIKIPPQADLPDFRFDVNQKAFFHTGVDLFGPFNVYTGRSKHKKEVYAAIFTCMVTRAVFLEVLDDQSTEGFMVAFNRLWTRRGPIAHMYSDNGRNFIGAARRLKKDEFQIWLNEKKIRWHFIPAFTPQFGGTWERLIKDIKRGLKSSIESFTVSRQTLEIIMSRIELNLNNRPLTELPVSPNDDAPITPYLLMTGHPNYPVCSENAEAALTADVNLAKLKLDRRVNSIVQAFRSRFVKEYAPIIARRRTNAKMPRNAIKNKDFVVYMDPTKNPSQWQRGMVIKTYPGPDNRIRVADVQMKNGEVIRRRSVYRLAKIDLHLESEAAEQNKYSAAINHLANENKNNAEPRTGKIQNLTETENHMRIFDDSTKIKADHTQDDESVMLTESEEAEFTDIIGNRTVVVRNLPSKLGLAEIYEVMSEYGCIKNIVVTNWDGEKPFSAYVCYSEPASVDTVLLFNESQLITIEGFVYRQQFERMRERLRVRKVFRKPFFQFGTVHSELGQKHKILTVTEVCSRANRLRKRIPFHGNAAGFIYCCARTHRYDFEIRAIVMEDMCKAVKELPCFPKSEKRVVNVVTTGSSNITTAEGQRTVNLRDDSLVISSRVEDPFQTGGSTSGLSKDDLRHAINKRKNSGSVIRRPQKASRYDGSSRSSGGTM